MQKDDNQTNENGNVLRICVAVLIFLFVVSVCILGLFIKENKVDRSIGGFIDIAPEYNRHTRFVIIGGRVFYPNKEAIDYTFPKEPPKETAIEDTDDASGETITLLVAEPDEDDDSVKDPVTMFRRHYSVTRYSLGDTRNKDYRDDVRWIELLAYDDGDEKKEWTQEAEIDLFRDDEGKILSLAPGTDGYFRFQLNNKSGTEIHAVMTIDEPEDGIHLPMIFSLEDEDSGKKSPATVLERDGAVRLSFDIDKGGSGVYRLNWQWPYESGDDAYDGAMGHAGGRYILNTTIYAETAD